jgi:nucleoside-diphosphate-sugar epimerase
MNLVTGATGHIGNVLVRKLLAAGESVRVLIFPGEDTLPLQDLLLEMVTGDVLDHFHPAGEKPDRSPRQRRRDEEHHR